MLTIFGQTNNFIGPEKGYLVIVGGGEQDSLLIKKFTDLINDTSSLIVVIPTAGEDWYINLKNNDLSYMKKTFISLGYNNISILHTRNKDTANSEIFVKPLRKAKGVWLTGGRHPLLADSYLNTLTLYELNNLLERGGVIGGTSGGATIMGSYLIRGTKENNTIILGDHTQGFNWVKNTVIDQHLLVRNRQWDMFEVLKKEPRLLGIGIDENTAIVVHQNSFEVIGDSYVTIYDKTIWSRYTNIISELKKGQKAFYLLKAGDKYDLKNRKVLIEK